MRGQSIFVVVVFLFLVLSATSVHLSFVINFFLFFLCIQVGRGGRGDDGEKTTPAGQHECDNCRRVYRQLTSLGRYRHYAHTGTLACPERGSVSQLTINYTFTTKKGRRPETVKNFKICF